jgi:hypothetical protein
VAVYEDPLTGRDISPDPGFSYNPGKAAWFPDLDKYDYDVARQYMQGGLAGTDFDAFFNGQLKGNYPVAVLDADFMKAIGTKSQAVYLSDESLAKNIANHPELELDVYRKLPGIIQNAQLVVKTGTTPSSFSSWERISITAR